jgi:putative PIN family toxin of toxin-antitoxin system
VALVAVIDTNVWVSAFLNPEGFPARLVAIGKTGRFAVVASLPLLEELHEVLSRPRILKIRQNTLSEVELFVSDVGAVAQLVAVTGEVKLCRDPDDDVVLETAIVGKATHLVSRDGDVMRDLALVRYLEAEGIQSVTVQRFLDLVAGEASPT